jgi:hypothetical protein
VVDETAFSGYGARRWARALAVAFNLEERRMLRLAFTDTATLQPILRTVVAGKSDFAVL